MVWSYILLKAVFFPLFKLKQPEKGFHSKMVRENIAVTYRTLCACMNRCSVISNCLKTWLLLFNNTLFWKKNISYLIISLFCLSVHAAGVCGAFGADGMRGEQNNQPLQTNADTRRCVRGAFSLCGVAHSSWSWHQQTGHSSTPGRHNCPRFLLSSNVFPVHNL